MTVIWAEDQEKPQNGNGHHMNGNGNGHPGATTTPATSSGCGIIPTRVRKEEASWAVGARYQAYETIILHARPDVDSEEVGIVQKKDTVLLLALQETDDNELLAYVADTRSRTPPQGKESSHAETKKSEASGWKAGWGLIRSSFSGPCLGWTPGRVSWEVGGRYSIAGNVVLRAGVELETEQMRWLQKDEEILILDLGLLIRGGEPKLRARVYTKDANFGPQIGWITVERPGSYPLLNPCNLLSERAVLGGPLTSVCAPLGCLGMLGAVAGVYDEEWHIGGQYRMLMSAGVTESSSSTTRTAVMKRGMLVLVEEIVKVPVGKSGAVAVRLKVTTVTSDGVEIRGWIPATRPEGQVLVDTRDHLEYIRVIQQAPLLTQDGQPYTPEVQPAEVEEHLHEAKVADLIGPDTADEESPEAVKASPPSDLLRIRTPELGGSRDAHRNLVAKPFPHLEEGNPEDRPIGEDHKEPESVPGICSCSRRGAGCFGGSA